VHTPVPVPAPVPVPEAEEQAALLRISTTRVLSLSSLKERKTENKKKITRRGSSVAGLLFC